MLVKRASGILMHITSLAGKFGIGDLGSDAYKFVDFLHDAGQNFWQILPLNYTCPEKGHSPYTSYSAFAGNPILISPDLLYEQGLIDRQTLREVPEFVSDKVEYNKASRYKNEILNRAFANFQNHKDKNNYESFKAENKFWLDDFAMFLALRQISPQKKWNKWPVKIRNRQKQALRTVSREYKHEIEKACFIQYIFYQQYTRLKKYANSKSISIIGDMPIYVSYDSSDLWAHANIFKLNRDKTQKFIAGVPPDYFSETGQLWGNPVYDWDKIKAQGYRWWLERIKHALKLYDIMRIDHFRGFVAYWQVPATHKTAQKGKWVPGPCDDFFRTLFARIPQAPIIAEDLGEITPDVREAVNKFAFPCMKVLHFGFDGDSVSNPHALHNHVKNSIAYTGTHDNNTTRGWFEKDISITQKKRLADYLGKKPKGNTITWDLIRLCMSSTAKIAIIPMQDILNLPAHARMNHPASTKGNWKWRLTKNKFPKTLTAKLKTITRTFGRC